MKTNRLFILAALVAMMLFAAGCSEHGEPSIEDEPSVDSTFVLKANVISVGDRLEVEVIESDYAFGVYWVLINESTVLEGSDGAPISLSDIQPADTVKIVYSGQTMMSYPPQIVGQRVILL